MKTGLHRGKWDSRDLWRAECETTVAVPTRSRTGIDEKYKHFLVTL